MGTKQDELYRQAARDALEQLDWCTGYFHGIHRQSISMQLAKNRAYIARQLLREAEEPLPSEVTHEA